MPHACTYNVCVFRLWHTACSGPDGEVFVFGGCANNLLAQQRAVRDLPTSVEHRTLCISEKLWMKCKLLLPLTGTQQWVIDLQCSAQVTSPVSVQEEKYDHLKRMNGYILTSLCENIRAHFHPYSPCPGSAWRPFFSTESVCLSTGTACLNTSCTASNWGWLTSTRWAPSLRRTWQSSLEHDGRTPPAWRRQV